MTEATKPKAKAVDVKLNQAHTHKRTPHKAGETIQVLPHTADYLEKRKIGTRV